MYDVAWHEETRKPNANKLRQMVYSYHCISKYHIYLDTTRVDLKNKMKYSVDVFSVSESRWILRLGPLAGFFNWYLT